MVGIKSKLEIHGGLYQTENLKSCCVVTYENMTDITNEIEVSKMSYHPKKEVKKKNDTFVKFHEGCECKSCPFLFVYKVWDVLYFIFYSHIFLFIYFIYIYL